MSGDACVIKDFLDLVLPDTGYRCIAHLLHKTGSFIPTFFAQSDNHMPAAKAISLDGSRLGEVYFGCASYADSSNRQGSNVLAVRSFWLDIDTNEFKAKGSNCYVDCLEALRELERFGFWLGLPAPVVINSGYGLHVYWPLDADISPDVWRDTAKLLQRACDLWGLKIDSSRTADIASVLRIPKTHNSKNRTDPKPVRLLSMAAPNSHAYFRGSLLSYVHDQQQSAPAMPAGLAGNLELKSTPDYWFDRLSPMAMHACLAEMLARPDVIALADTSDSAPNPNWRTVVAACVRCGAPDARSLCETWAKTSARYDPADFERRWSSYGRADHGISVGTLIKIARDGGWDDKPWKLSRSLPSVVVSNSTGLLHMPHTLPAANAVAELNKYVAFAHDWGGKSTFVLRDPDGGQQPRTRAEFRDMLANRRVEDDQGKQKPLFPFWEASDNRREFAKVVYDPAQPVENGSGGAILNLWRGFNCEARRGRCGLMLRHLFRVVCNGNMAHFRYLLAWMAHLVQRPWEAPGAAVVLRSQREGTGKTTVMNWLATILGNHAMLMNTPDQLLGRFNAHLETISFVGLNELGWAGNKDSEAKLKSIITDPTITVERKHGGIYSVPNILHIMATSNSDWVVPAGNWARRYFVLDLDPGRAGDAAYFTALHREADTGGIEAFMHVLSHVNLARVSLRAVPATEALREQQERSLPFTAQWALDLAERGGGASGKLAPAGRITFGQPVEYRALYHDYVEYAASRGAKPLATGPFGKWLARVGLQDTRTSRQRQRNLPSADEFAESIRKDAGVRS